MASSFDEPRRRVVSNTDTPLIDLLSRRKQLNECFG
jgi:hypothetical protein